jgi:hypothetical protein
VAWEEARRDSRPPRVQAARPAPELRAPEAVRSNGAPAAPLPCSRGLGYDRLVLGVRDFGWAVMICFGLTFAWDCRPARDARRFVERESREGFLDAYTGHRFVTGELIMPESSGGAHADPTAIEVMARRFEIIAQRTAFSGGNAELVAKHVIKLMDGTAEGHDVSQEVHVRIARESGRWVYVLFEVRGHGVVDDPNSGNPWARAIRQTPQEEGSPHG